MKDISTMGMSQEASAIRNKSTEVGLGMIDYFHVECFDAEGNFKWKETIKNLVTNEGLDYIINCGFNVSQSQITSWYVGLKATGSPAPGDTATELPGTTMLWTEYEDYDAGTRPALTLADTGTGQVDNSAAQASYTIASPADQVFGVFVVDSSAKGSNSLATVLYGVGDFAAAKTVDADDTLNVTVTLSATSA